MGLEKYPEVVLYQGEDKDIGIWIEDEKGLPFDLTSAAEILVLIPKDDGTAFSLSKTGGQVAVINAGGGGIKARISAAQSIHVNLGDNQAIEIRVTIGGYLTVAQVQNAITVLPSLFPGA